MESRNLYKVAIEGFVLAGCVLLFCSCLSFDISDAPSEYAWPHNNPTLNWCGSWGAYPAYYLQYYVGPGVFILLGAVAWALVAHLAGVQMTQPILRAVGLLLVTIAFSGTVYLLWPYSPGGFPMGNGGILGIAAGNFLKSHIAVLGTFIVISSAWIVGAVLLADSVVLAMVRWFGAVVARAFGLAVPAWSAAKRRSQEIGRIWQKLSEAQKQRRELKSSAVAEREEYEEHEEYKEYEEDDSEAAGPMVSGKTKQLKITAPR